MSIGYRRCVPASKNSPNKSRSKSEFSRGDFDIAHMELPYNAILSYPALAKFMMVTHHAYNTVKLPGSNDSITIRSDKKDAVRSVERAFKDAAAAFSDENEDLEPSDTPAKKKLFTEERTATKKVSLDANG